MKIHNDNISDCTDLNGSLFNLKYNATKLFFTIVFTLYLAISLTSFIWDIEVLTKINILIGLFALILLSTNIRRDHLIIYVFIGILLSSFIVSSLFVWRTDWRLFQPIYFIVSSTGIAMILLRKYVYSWGGYIVFYSLSVYFLLLMLAGSEGYSVLKYSSWNGISMVMLVACISLYIILSIENKKLDLLPALLTLSISIWAIGRSGIISSAVLLLGLVFIRYRSKPKFIVIIYLFIAIIFYVVFMYAMDSIILRNAVDHYIATDMNMEDTERWVMWSNYINNLDIFRVIFGANVVEDPWPEGLILEYNYHNSFINLHLQTGLIGLITLAIIILSIFKFYRINQIYLILFLSLMLRSSTDTFIFFGRFDFIPYFFIFYYLKSLHYRNYNINTLFADPNNILRQV